MQLKGTVGPDVSAAFIDHAHSRQPNFRPQHQILWMNNIRHSERVSSCDNLPSKVSEFCIPTQLYTLNFGAMIQHSQFGMNCHRCYYNIKLVIPNFIHLSFVISFCMSKMNRWRQSLSYQCYVIYTEIIRKSLYTCFPSHVLSSWEKKSSTKAQFNVAVCSPVFK